eukprot:scaffold36144_cov17-Tisochrysis_lutea.AAC.1
MNFSPQGDLWTAIHHKQMQARNNSALKRKMLPCRGFYCWQPANKLSLPCPVCLPVNSSRSIGLICTAGEARLKQSVLISGILPTSVWGVLLIISLWLPGCKYQPNKKLPASP